MNKKTVVVMVAFLGLGAGAFYWLSASKEISHAVSDKEAQQHDDGLVFQGIPSHKDIDSIDPNDPSTYAPDENAKALTALQEKFEKLSNKQILEEMAQLKNKMKEDNLIERLNKNLVDPTEKAQAKELLVKLALLRVEKAKRSAQGTKVGARDHDK